MAAFGRIITAMVTPFDEGGEVDYSQAERLALALLESGSDGLVVSGTTGESPTLTHEEKLNLFARIKSKVGTRNHVIAGTGSYSTRESIQLTREAEEAGVDGALLVVPYYNRPTQEGLYEHFKAIAQATRLPCILYNVPGRTGTNMAAETVIRLSQTENIVGVKEASANLDQMAKIVQGTPSDFLLYTGNDNDLLPTLSLGGYGVISVASHLVGLQMQRLIEAFLAGKVAEASTLHRHLLPLFNALFVISNPIPVKHALNHIGFRVGKPRLPLTEPDARSAAVIEAALKESQIDLPMKERSK